MPHLKYGPSGSSRWLACPASLNHDGDSDTPSQAAAEGTAAHKLCQRCWLLGCEPAGFLGDDIDGFEVTEEMAQGAQLFLDTIEAVMAELGATSENVFSEVFIHSKDHPEFGGTIDILIRTESRIAVIDFKYGMQPVHVTGNTQLLCYASLARENDEEVVVAIVQPRAHHEDGPVRSWDISSDRLDEFRQQVDAVIEAGPSETFEAGDHCQYCPRKKDCPELYQLTLKMAQDEFDDASMTPERAAELLSKKKAITGYLKAIDSYAHGRLDKGEPIPGYKLVNAFGNRRFCVDEEAIVRKCRSKKFGKKQIYKTELMSPAQLEKVVGRELVNSLVERPLNGTTVVPETDKRPAVERLDAAEEFAKEQNNNG